MFRYSFYRPILQLLGLVLLCFSASAQTINKFEEGHFTDDKGYVYNGFICLHPSAYEFKGSKNPRILFKSDKDADKQSILLQDVESFVIKQDSFVTARRPGSAEYYWLRVVIDGPVKVYQTEIYSGGGGGGGIRPSIGIGGGGGGFGGGIGGGVGISIGGGRGGGRTSGVYVYGNDESAVQELNRKNYVEVLEKAVSDNLNLAGKIKDKTYRYGDLEKLGEDYRKNSTGP